MPAMAAAVRPKNQEHVAWRSAELVVAGRCVHGNADDYRTSNIERAAMTGDSVNFLVITSSVVIP
jgi:hypothetical protein